MSIPVPQIPTPKQSDEITIQQIKKLVANPPQGSVPFIITPGVAAFILEQYKNPSNRAHKPTMIEFFTSEMLQGKWLLTGAPIIISDTRKLSDGQNRLRACVKAQVPFLTDMRFGIPDENFSAMDQGRNRNGKDLLDIEGCKNPDDTATAIRWVYMITNNKMKSNSSLPPQVALELYRGEYKGVEKFCAYGQKIYANRGAPRALATALCYLFWQADQRKAQEFIEAWSTGNETYINPLRHAHEHMTRLRDRHLIQKAGKEMRITYAAMIIKAWNLFCVGRRKCYAKAVIYNIHEEQFPMIDGLEVTRYFIKLAIDPSNPPKSTTKKAA